MYVYFSIFQMLEIGVFELYLIDKNISGLESCLNRIALKIINLFKIELRCII